MSQVVVKSQIQKCFKSQNLTDVLRFRPIFHVKSIYISESTHKVSRSNNNLEPLNWIRALCAPPPLLTGLWLWVFYIHGRPVQGGKFTGNQVPAKCISSSQFFGRIHALSHFAKFNPGMWAHNKWFFVTRIDILWQELISCDKNGFFVKRINFLSQELISKLKIQKSKLSFMN